MGFDFKEMLLQDCEEVFLNPEEFGSWHRIDGRKMVIQADDSEVTERSKKQVERTEGIYKRQFLFYVLQKNFGPLPAVGRAIDIDGTVYKILEASSEGGIYSILVGRDKS